MGKHNTRKDVWTELSMGRRHWVQFQQMASSGTSALNMQWVGAQFLWVLNVEVGSVSRYSVGTI